MGIHRAPEDPCVEWKEEIHAMRFDRAVKMGTQYIKEKQLGAGAFGEGWRCKDKVNKRTVVVKISHKGLVGEKEEYMAKKEVNLMQRMDHPNVVKFHEAWVEGEGASERLHIAMEYCDGGDLRAVLDKRLKDKHNGKRLAAAAKAAWKYVHVILEETSQSEMQADRACMSDVLNRVLPIGEKVLQDTIEDHGKLDTFTLEQLESWTVQLLWGLWYIHKQHVVHRDIKPDNIFLAGGGAIIKIGDFGISGLQAHTNGVNNTRTGTPLYMAPEVWQGESYTDRVDVFSVGCMLYELACLMQPFDGVMPLAHMFPDARWTREDFKLLQRKMTNHEVQPMKIPAGQVEPQFTALIMTMLRKEPKLRPTSGQVLRSIRLQPAVRRVLAMFEKYEQRGPSPLVENSDARHHQVQNPANHYRTLKDGAKFQASYPEAEILMALTSQRLSVRKAPSFESAKIGYIIAGDIVEVAERVANAEGRWLKVQSGWCLAEYRGDLLFVPCKEEFIARDALGIEVLLGRKPASKKGADADLAAALKKKMKDVGGGAKVPEAAKAKVAPKKISPVKQQPRASPPTRPAAAARRAPSPVSARKGTPPRTARAATPPRSAPGTKGPPMVRPPASARRPPSPPPSGRVRRPGSPPPVKVQRAVAKGQLKQL